MFINFLHLWKYSKTRKEHLLLPELKFSTNGRTDLRFWSYSITHMQAYNNESPAMRLLLGVMLNNIVSYTLQLSRLARKFGVSARM